MTWYTQPRNFHAEADALIAQGYRRTSNRHRIVSRIDRPDWVLVLARKMHRSPAEFLVIDTAQIAGTWCDHYRRCYSKDKLEGVEPGVFALIPGSGHDPCGYKEKPGDPKITA